MKTKLQTSQDRDTFLPFGFFYVFIMKHLNLFFTTLAENKESCSGRSNICCKPPVSICRYFSA